MQCKVKVVQGKVRAEFPGSLIVLFVVINVDKKGTFDNGCIA